ncbi:MAG: hypothetical protein KA173_00030 [Rhodoferax sp.]|nr:hypothetical protein [Rhodoferax sp.]MBP7492375.1 hypothetical protein [Rhodoferax sp.]
MKIRQFIKTFAASMTAVSVLAGCATAGKDVVGTYVSPAQFSTYDCDQVRQEMVRISSRVNQLSGRLDEAANNDKTIGVVGAILFWPALFALGGTKGQEAELARLKGEYDALQAASAQKKCG